MKDQIVICINDLQKYKKRSKILLNMQLKSSSSSNSSSSSSDDDGGSSK